MQRRLITSLIGCTTLGYITLGLVSSVMARDPNTLPKPAADAVKKATDGMKKMDPTKAGEAAAAQAPDQAEAMAWMQAMTPGEMHTWLAKGAGTWNATVTAWMTPGGPPATNQGTMTTIMTLGGRYQHFQFKGEFANMPFEGAGTLGYNNVTGKFESTWMDNMSTGTMYLTGTYDKATRTMMLSGDFIDPVTKKNITQKEVSVWADDDHIKSEFFHKGADGKDVKVMEIAYVRAADDAKPAAAAEKLAPKKTPTTTPPTPAHK